MKMKIYAASLKSTFAKKNKTQTSPQTCTQHRCGQIEIVSAVCLPAGLLVCPWGPLQNHPWITMIQCLNVASKSEAERRENRRKRAQCAGAYLLSVSQVLVFDVAQRLPVGVAAPAAGFHLRQRLSLHRVTHLVIPAREKRKKKIHYWSEATRSPVDPVRTFPKHGFSRQRCSKDSSWWYIMIQQQECWQVFLCTTWSLQSYSV